MKFNMWPGARRRMLKEKTEEPGNKNDEKKQKDFQADSIRMIMIMTVTQRIKRSTRGVVMIGLRANSLASYVGKIHGHTLS